MNISVIQAICDSLSWFKTKCDDTFVSKSSLNSVTSQVKSLFLLMHPVGSIYMSTSATSPQTTFGGTWQAWGAGRVPIGFGSNGTTNYSTVNATGGAESRSHSHVAKTSGTPSNNTSGSPSNNTSGSPSNNTSGSTTLSVNQMPSHTHRLGWFMTSGDEAKGYGLTPAAGFQNRVAIQRGSDPGTSNYHVARNEGGSGGHTHTLSSHTHSLQSHTHSLQSHTHSIPASDSIVTDIRQPYQVCYMWRRTA